jgi:energy-coupling factor transport system substrate-specific component
MSTQSLDGPTLARRRRSSNGDLPSTLIVALVPTCAALNIVGGYIANALRLPIYLDMIGTAISAIVLGPWWGALVGVIGNCGQALIIGPVSIPFALVNVAGALLWGYGVRRLGLGRTFPRFFALNIVVALGCTLVSVPIYVTLFGGATGNVADALTASFVAMGQKLYVSVFSSNILTTLADKIIGGFIAIEIIHALPEAWTAKLDVVQTGGMRRVLYIVGVLVVSLAMILLFFAVKN